jgi:hypothetical protein
MYVREDRCQGVKSIHLAACSIYERGIVSTVINLMRVILWTTNIYNIIIYNIIIHMVLFKNK